VVDGLTRDGWIGFKLEKVCVAEYGETNIYSQAFHRLFS
jgi:hypothetical protein